MKKNSNYLGAERFHLFHRESNPTKSNQSHSAAAERREGPHLFPSNRSNQMNRGRGEGTGALPAQNFQFPSYEGIRNKALLLAAYSYARRTNKVLWLVAYFIQFYSLKSEPFFIAVNQGSLTELLLSWFYGLFTPCRFLGGKSPQGQGGPFFFQGELRNKGIHHPFQQK